ncbi:hypothetical protein JCM11641_002985 [Rhodosporidiobolus odoratus]
MSPEQIREELLVLMASLVDGELKWDDEDEQRAWELAINDETAPLRNLSAPSFAVHVAPHVDLGVQYRRDALPSFAIQSLVLERKEQVRIADEVKLQAKQIEEEDNPLPVFTLLTALQAWLVANPPALVRQASQEPTAPPPRPKAGPLQLKVVLLWSHHLLATGKRKDIVAWSTELELFGLSKPGYPGVIVIEGLQDQVDEFVHRIKQLQWKALQVRCEQDGPVVSPPSSVSPAEASTWVVRNRSQLGSIISRDSTDKICVREVEGLNEVGEIMKKAGLYEVFLTAMKLNK